MKKTTRITLIALFLGGLLGSFGAFGTCACPGSNPWGKYSTPTQVPTNTPAK